jgi:hypothetical protein
MEYREEAAPMMRRDGALLMRGGGRKKGGERTGGCGELKREGPEGIISKADGRQKDGRRGDRAVES